MYQVCSCGKPHLNPIPRPSSSFSYNFCHVRFLYLIACSIYATECFFYHRSSNKIEKIIREEWGDFTINHSNQMEDNCSWWLKALLKLVLICWLWVGETQNHIWLSICGIKVRTVTHTVMFVFHTICRKQNFIK